jgi:phosphate uptake regulator
MGIPHAQTRFRAATMELVAYLDERRVDMHIITETGEAVAVTCDRDSIFRVQRSIERMGRDCPEIASWGEGSAG